MAEIIHKAVELSKVKVARRKVLMEPGYLAQNYIAQPKHDGCNAIITLNFDGTASTTSRTGEPNRAMGRSERALSSSLENVVRTHGGLVVLGEAWWPGNDQFSEISGHFRRHEESDRLRFVAFDCLTPYEFSRGKSDQPYLLRLKRLLCGTWPEDKDSIQLIRSYRLPHIVPQSLCDQLVLKGGYDGVIYRDPQGLWERGRGTTGELIKIKRKLSFDLRVTAVHEGLGKNAGRVGAISLSFKGKELRCNAGTDAEREAWWLDPTLIVGKIVEVEAMDLSSEGLLREPRYKGIRHDKDTPDA